MARKATQGPHRWQYELGKRGYTFQAEVDEFIRKSEILMLGVVRESVQELVEVAQVPVAKGGKMRVDTGFLRGSGQGALNSMPAGPTRGEAGKTYTWSGESLKVILAKMKLGETIYFGWTADYAKYREAYDGFLESAVMKWPKIVADNVKKLKDMLK